MLHELFVMNVSVNEVLINSDFRAMNILETNSVCFDSFAVSHLAFRRTGLLTKLPNVIIFYYA